MRGIILAGGFGTRLLPLTHCINKHLLPIGRKTMIEYPISTLKNAGIERVCVVLGGNNAGDFVEYLGRGEDFQVDVYYRYQGDAKGIAHAIYLCEDFIGNDDKFAVILGDNIFEHDFRKDIFDFAVDRKHGCYIFIVQSDTPRQFGVVEIDDNGNIIGIEEKPVYPKSNLVVTGLYLYNKTFFDKFKKCNISARGEYEISDINRMYLNEHTLKPINIEGFWSDAGNFETMHLCNKFAWERQLIPLNRRGL